MILKEVNYDAQTHMLAITLKDNYVKLLNKDFTQEKDINNLRFEFKVDLQHVRFKQKPELKKKQNEISYLAKQLVLAHQIDRFIKNHKSMPIGEVSKYLNITPARIYQITALLQISPSIQEDILLNDSKTIHSLSEHSIRNIPMEIRWDRQKQIWDSLTK